MRLLFVHESRLVSLSLFATCAVLLLACSGSTTRGADGGALDAGSDPITGEPGMDAGTRPSARDAGDSYDPDDPPGGDEPDGGSDQTPGGDGDGDDGDGDDGDGDDGDGDEPDPPDGPSDDELEWRRANLTEFISYPDPDSDECKYFNGCEYPGYFAAFNGMQQSMDWVDEHNILAVHSRDFDTYVWKTLRIRADGHEIEAVVYDLCSDNDCNGCCTNNASETGFLIDMETHTKQRFGGGDGVVEWACVDCD